MNNLAWKVLLVALIVVDFGHWIIDYSRHNGHKIGILEFENMTLKKDLAKHKPNHRHPGMYADAVYE